MNFESLEMERKFLESIQCPVCLETYSDNIKPCVIPCGHSLCLECKKGLVKNNQINCPICRQLFEFNPNQLGINYDLLNTAIIYIESKKIIEHNVTKVSLIIARLSASQSYGFDYKKVNITGDFIVGNVEPKSLSYRAGLRNDDCVVEVNDVKLKSDMSEQDFLDLINKYRLEIRLTVLRGHNLLFNTSIEQFTGSLKAIKPEVQNNQSVLLTTINNVEF